MEKQELPSGSIMEIDLLSYEESWHISQIFSEVCKQMDFDLKSLELDKLARGEKKFSAVDVVVFKGPLLTILSSKEIIEAAKRCWVRCTIDKLRIDDSTFNRKEKRRDFLPAAFHALRANIAPFFDGLLSGSPMN